MIYLDSSATSFLKPPQVAKAVYESFSKLGNAGRGAHSPTLNASRLIFDTRRKLGLLFGIDNVERIVFTGNATESLNMVIQGLFCPGDHVITTACEHNSVLRPLYLIEKKGVEVSILPANQKGTLDYSSLENVLQDNTKAMVVTHASNLTGNVTDLASLSKFAQKHNLVLIVDASQTAGAIPIDVRKMGIDILCFTGHKGLMGPQGTGGLYVREGIEIAPLKVGGSGVHSFEKAHPSEMPTALEAGTHNGHGIAGLNAALDFLLEIGVEKIHEREDFLARYFVKQVSKIEGVTVYGDREAKLRVPIVTLNIKDFSSSEVSDYLWEDYEICVRGGAHCAPLMHEALGTVEQGAIRFSFSYFNTKEEVDVAIAAIKEIAE